MNRRCAMRWRSLTKNSASSNNTGDLCMASHRPTCIRRALFLLLFIVTALLSGCARSPLPEHANTTPDSITVISKLAEQLHLWHGTPYHYGGMTHRGVDCSGFVMLTFRDKFHTVLPRETRDQASTGERIAQSDLQPGDLVFFKTGRGDNGLHVGIYNGGGQFIHASTRKGVTRSVLSAPYWQKHFWQARRLVQFH